MTSLDLGPIRRAWGTVKMPGSKSISNRVLLLAALARGDTVVRDLLDADDTRVMLHALAHLGVNIERRPGGTALVHGVGGKFPAASAELHLGNAGTAFRPLVAALALAGGEYRLSGVPRMHERPIGDLVEALRRLGADIAYLDKEGFPPLHIRARAIRGGPARVRGEVSSQYLSALLMALPLAGAGREVEIEGELVSKPYVEITLNLMRRFGVEVAREGWKRFSVPAARYSSPGEIRVEGDASSASYFLAAGAIGGGPVRVEGVGRSSIQGDIGFAAVLEKMGATISMGEDWIESGRPAGGKLKPVDADLNHIPDAAMTAAVAALFAQGTSTLRNIASWRVKETDRIAAMAKELKKLGAAVEEGADFIRVTPPAALRPATLDTYDDHRMAMSLSLAALGGVRLRINDPECVGKTFPEYFEALASISAPVIAIDGPSASGKGTVARLLARELGFHYLDSGALYRLVALGAGGSDEAAATAFAERLPTPAFEGEQVIFGGRDVSDAIRTEEVSAAASFVARIPEVRAALLGRQRAFRRPPGLVAEGRDMGSVVFPGAELKVFLTASPEARAERRHKQLNEKGIAATLAALLQDLRERDARDATRSAAPLKQSPGARPLDTTSMSAEQAAALIAGWYRGANR
ncbi:MAG TPA: bifunctional 3-phosphoshikimate 1-carboxyvinyltransferase/cytidylate kinase [Burkholderiales bacterium]|nr:bifunctional 3-phosphoshikimate 1-carboxyvinyltransferase/cytidylate kinase [Burkholderiales bacterium]